MSHGSDFGEKRSEVGLKGEHKEGERGLALPTPTTARTVCGSDCGFKGALCTPSIPTGLKGKGQCQGDLNGVLVGCAQVLHTGGKYSTQGG